MPQAHVPDNDITFVYVRELSESIRSVSGVMQGLTSELHQHAIALHQLKAEVSGIESKLKTEVAGIEGNVKTLIAIVRDGQGNRMGLLNRVEELERDIRDNKKEREEEKQEQEKTKSGNRTFRASIYVLIIGVVVNLLVQAATWMTTERRTPTEISKKASQ